MLRLLDACAVFDTHLAERGQKALETWATGRMQWSERGDIRDLGSIMGPLSAPPHRQPVLAAQLDIHGVCTKLCPKPYRVCRRDAIAFVRSYKQMLTPDPVPHRCPGLRKTHVGQLHPSIYDSLGIDDLGADTVQVRLLSCYEDVIAHCVRLSSHATLGAVGGSRAGACGGAALGGAAGSASE